MAFIRRDWDPVHADEWTKEDWIAIVLSPLAYIFLSIGTGLSILLLPIGFITFSIGIVLTILMHYVIDPKLKMISSEYEKRQREYLEERERKVRWEKKNG